MRESKDKIKARMISNASKIWGFQEPQSESSFDPLVSLLLGACAFELEKISGEINNSESRIIERMVNILTPQPITGPQPAYAVIYAKPCKRTVKVLPDYQFYTNIKVSDQSGKRKEDKQIFFSPTGTFGLTDGRIRYIADYKGVYEIVKDQYTDIIAEKFIKPLSRSVIYFGLELNEIPEKLTFFFNLINEHLKQSFFTELESCIWKTGDIRINTQKGISDLDRSEHNVNQFVSRHMELGSKVADYVNHYFNRQFVTLLPGDIKDNSILMNGKIPDSLRSAIGEKGLSNIADQITWFELEFPGPVSEELLENLTCSLNCFPVINRRLNEYTGSTREILNIIPLHTEDVFLELKNVSNSNGEAYKINHFISQYDIKQGSALLRSDGIGRFDARNAMEYLDYLLELMKEESAAFNVMGSDMIASNLRELNQTIARLEKKMENVQLESGDTAYLMLKPWEGDRQVFVEFWSTNCTLANNIQAGSILSVYRADDIDYNYSRLMTATMGGKEKPSTEDRINTFRRSLLSGDRVVTKEDIKALCLEYFGESVSEVNIEKGIQKGNRKSEGFIRTIDIYLTMKKGHEMNLAEQNALRQELLVMLEERSSNIFPFRVFMKG